jgi:3-polyprenyl-4-hydroxybenzoate decarboxylase
MEFGLMISNIFMQQFARFENKHTIIPPCSLVDVGAVSIGACDALVLLACDFFVELPHKPPLAP